VLGRAVERHHRRPPPRRLPNGMGAGGCSMASPRRLRLDGMRQAGYPWMACGTPAAARASTTTAAATASTPTADPGWHPRRRLRPWHPPHRLRLDGIWHDRGCVAWADDIPPKRPNA
jgi:hypothetical protein